MYWPQQFYQQLVLGVRTDGTSFVEIGSFAPDDKLDQFNWESETPRKVDDSLITYLQSLWVGNFDNLNADGTHNPKPQIETYEIAIGAFLTGTPHLQIFDVNAPAPPPPNALKPTNWLK